MNSAKEIVEKFENESDREKVSLYLSKKIYEKFKKSCGNAPASKVMEYLMKKFVESSKTGNDIEL